MRLLYCQAYKLAAQRHDSYLISSPKHRDNNDTFSWSISNPSRRTFVPTFPILSCWQLQHTLLFNIRLNHLYTALSCHQARGLYAWTCGRWKCYSNRIRLLPTCVLSDRASIPRIHELLLWRMAADRSSQTSFSQLFQFLYCVRFR